MSRIEGITDAVIGMALALLIVSLGGDTAEDLKEAFAAIPALFVCFVLILMCWYYHFQFHRRFGLENLYTIFLNALLLFLILAYVFPLKFLFTNLFRGGGGNGGMDGRMLMTVYSTGVVCIFSIFALMHAHAYKHRALLELNTAECHITRTTIREHLIHVGIGVASITLALTWSVPASGLVYFLTGPLQAFNGIRSGRQLERLLANEPTL